MNLVDAGLVVLSLYDANGRLVQREELEYADVGEYRMDLDLQYLNPGVYMLTLQQGDAKASKRLVVEQR